MRVLHNRLSKNLIPTLILVSFALTESACSWTPQVRTSLYENTKGSVSLLTVSGSNFHATHPVELSTQTIVLILRGLHIQQHTGLLQGLMGGNPSKERVFSESQISWMAPVLQKAFSQITPEEQVHFQVDPSHHSQLGTIHGMMFIDGTDLVVSINRENRGTVQSSKQNPATNSRNPAGVLAESLVFIPEHAVRKPNARSWLTDSNTSNQIVIDFTALSNPQRHGSPAPPKQESTRNGGTQFSSPASKNSVPEQESAPRSTASSSPRPTIDTQNQPDNQHLLEEIQKLRERLEAQEAEIEELKKK